MFALTPISFKRTVVLLVILVLVSGGTVLDLQGDTGQPDATTPELADSSTSVSGEAEEPHYIIRIERLTVTNMALLDTMDVVLESFGQDIAGYVLKFGFDSRHLDVLEILPGEIPDSCSWDLFRPLRINTGNQLGFPAVLWQVTGLAKRTLDTTRPDCYGFDRPASLFRLVVSSAHVPEVPDTTAPIYFFWESCRDNVLSDASGDRMVVSDTVIDYFPVSRSGENVRFPTRFGTPQSCINPDRKNAPIRRIDFHNGGVEFKFDPGKPLENHPDSG